MSNVTINIYDKTSRLINVTNRNFTVVNAAMALLELTFPFNQSPLKFFESLYDIFRILRFDSGGVHRKCFGIEAYDNINKSVTDLCGAIVCNYIAKTLFNQIFLLPFNFFPSSNGLHPDFIGLSNRGLSLFEAKGSLNRVQSTAVRRGLSQINSPVGFYSNRVLVCSHFNSSSKAGCLTVDVYDPEGINDFVMNEKLIKYINEFYNFIYKIKAYSKNNDISSYVKYFSIEIDKQIESNLRNGKINNVEGNGIKIEIKI